DVYSPWRRGYGIAGLGAHVVTYVYSLGRDTRVCVRSARLPAGRRGGHQERHAEGRRPLCLWLSEGRAWRASPGTHFAVRCGKTTAYVVCGGVGHAGSG